MGLRQHSWQVRSTGVPTAAGQQRWDRVYQLLLQWAATNLPPAPVIRTGADLAGDIPCT